jgi:hypothetical protein
VNSIKTQIKSSSQSSKLVAQTFLIHTDPAKVGGQLTFWHMKLIGACGGAVVEALRYKPEGGRINQVLLEFFIDILLPTALSPGVDSASNRNEYQEYFLGVKPAGA